MTISASHPHPHLDEYVGGWLLGMFGGDMFPDGCPTIGYGGSEFDEHLPEGGRQPGECAATLIAKAVGVSNDPRLRALLRFVLKTDEGPSNHPLDLAAVILTFRRLERDPEEVSRWVREALNAYWGIVKDLKDPDEIKQALDRARNRWSFDLRTPLQEINLHPRMGGKVEKLCLLAAKRLEPGGTCAYPFDLCALASIIATFHDDDVAGQRWIQEGARAILEGQQLYYDARGELERFERWTIQSGRCSLVVAAGQSDNPLVAQFARSKDGVQIAIVVQRLFTGNVLIHCTNDQVPQDMADLIAERIKAQEPKGPDRWYYHKKARVLLNGSRSVEQPPTEQSRDQIVGAIRSAILDFWKHKR